jgi:putative PIN family toxin of toxin-antitoxin system
MLPDRVVFDPNVIISYAISRKLNEFAEVKTQYRIEIYSCPELIGELSSSLDYPKVSRYFTKQSSAETILFFKEVATEFEIQLSYNRLIDPDDNYLVDLAYASKSDFIITGDRNVLIQKHVGRIQIISPAQFHKLLKENS